VNGSSLKKGISVDSLLEKIPVNTDTKVGTVILSCPQNLHPIQNDFFVSTIYI
jgi:hypothetical protein